jgi:hypothetical protein
LHHAIYSYTYIEKPLFFSLFCLLLGDILEKPRFLTHKKFFYSDEKKEKEEQEGNEKEEKKVKNEETKVGGNIDLIECLIFTAPEIINNEDEGDEYERGV